MEKKKLTQEMLDKIDPSLPLEEMGFEFIETLLPYSELEKAAFELVDAVLILDPLGIVYENYSLDLERCYVILKYCTDIDVDGWDKETLYRVFGLCIAMEMWQDNVNINRIEDMYNAMKKIVTRRHETENSLQYKLGLLVDALAAQTEGNAKEMGDRLIDLMAKAKEADEKPSAPVLTMFAKKG